MKKLLPAAACLLVLFAGLQSCQKEAIQCEVIKEIIIDTTIAAGSDYYLDLAPYGNEDNTATIVESGAQASISRLEDETDMFTYIYHYASNPKATGTDHVTIGISKACSKDSTLIYLNITLK